MSRQPSKLIRFQDLPGIAYLIGWFVAGKQEQHYQDDLDKKKRRRWKYRVKGDEVNFQVFIGTEAEYKLFKRNMRRKHGKDYFL